MNNLFNNTSIEVLLNLPIGKFIYFNNFTFSVYRKSDDTFILNEIKHKHSVSWIDFDTLKNLYNNTINLSNLFWYNL